MFGRVTITVGIGPHSSLTCLSVVIIVVEVATLKKTRHENLVLFMGACMTPPKLAIVTRSVGRRGCL